MNIYPLTNAPYRGQVLSNALNGEVLEFHQRNAEGNGLLASWFVLCFLPSDTYTPYVVWSLTKRPEGWHTESGNYYRTLDEAQQGYNKRAGLTAPSE